MKEFQSNSLNNSILNEGSGMPVLFGDSLAISIIALILDDVNDAITIGTISSPTNDTRRISIPKSAPPIGELNVAAIALLITH